MIEKLRRLATDERVKIARRHADFLQSSVYRLAGVQEKGRLRYEFELRNTDVLVQTMKDVKRLESLQVERLSRAKEEAKAEADAILGDIKRVKAGTSTSAQQEEVNTLLKQRESLQEAISVCKRAQRSDLVSCGKDLKQALRAKRELFRLAQLRAIQV